MMKLAIITTHPIQYYAPWFKHLARQTELRPRVFYLWDFGVTEQVDAGFKRAVRWDVPLLEGYEYEFVPNVSARPGTSHFWGLRNPALVRQVNAYDPEAVLLLGYNYASLLSFVLHWRRTPLLFRGDSHRLLPRSGSKEQLRRKLIAYVFGRFAAFLYVGRANRDYFHYHGVADEKLFFVPHAVDNTRFLAAADEAAREARVWRKELGIPEHHAVVLFAGKLESQKRPQDLLAAFSTVAPPETTLLFVGNGELEEQLRRETGTQRHIVFAPFQNQTRMPRTYVAADMLVLPSESETWGLAVNEAMCMSRAVIVSTHVGCAQDLVQPYRNGLTFPAGDVQALARCLREALSDRERLRAWGAEGHMIIKQYSYEHATQGLLQALTFIDKSEVGNEDQSSINVPDVA
jgi:glycosyltransferase involved in cell wall biosynthesis